MIPNRAMFYWGGGPLSWLRFNTLWSFRRLHPDWEMRLFIGNLATPPAQRWQEHLDWMPQAGAPIERDYLPNVRDLGVEIATWTCPAGYPNATPPHCNDLCRWGALSQFGGWFFDMDILFVDNMAALGADGQRADVAIIPARDWIPTGFIGAKAGNEFTAACYSAALAAPDKSRFRAAGAEAIARVTGLSQGEWLQHTRNQFSNAMARAFPHLKWWMLGQMTAYRWEWFDANKIFATTEAVMPQTVAIHWYGSQRVAQRAMRKLTEQNYRGTENVLTQYIRDLADAGAVLPDAAAPKIGPAVGGLAEG